MLNFGASKPRVKGGPGPPGPPLDPHLSKLISKEKVDLTVYLLVPVLNMFFS